MNIAGNGKHWYSIKALSTNENQSSIEVMIYDEIGLWGVNAGQFIKEFQGVDDGKSPVTVAINSPGGDVFDGFALNGWASRLGDRCTIRVDGVAASAASVIAAGGHQVIMSESAMMMIHNPWTMAYGGAEDLRKTADMIDKARDGIVAAYRRKAPAIDANELIKMLDDETWLTADEAVALGLADAIGESASIQACQGSNGVLARFKKAPHQMLASKPPESRTKPAHDSPPPKPITANMAAKLTAACVNAGLPQIAESILMNTPLDDEMAVTAEADRIQQIADLCVIARLPELAADYAKSGLSVEAVRARLFDQLISGEKEGIDNKQPSSGPTEKPPEPNATEIYAARNTKARDRKPVKGSKK